MSAEQVSVFSDGQYDRDIFPHSEAYPWNLEYYGPLTIPAKGTTVELNSSNLPLYRRIIEAYEQNQLELKGEKIYINGEVATSYTFQMDYFFMMGDNRHQSADSRFWGFVPEPYIIGCADFILFSVNKNKNGLNKIRWNRICKNVKKWIYQYIK